MLGGFYNPHADGGSLTIQDEGVTLGVATVINFVGSGVTATILGGVVTVSVPGGGSANYADENLTDSGDHTNFTISHTPIAGALQVINVNTGQTVDKGNYTNTGTAIAFTSNQQIDNQDGTFTTPTFRARYVY